MTDTTVAPPAPAAAPAAPPAAPAAAPAPRSTLADNAYDRLGPEDQGKYSRIKNADNLPEWVRRDQLATDRTTAKPDGATTTEAPPHSDPTAKVQIGEMFVSQSELQEFFQARGADELRKASLPQSPNDYAAELPANFQLPQGVEFKIDPNDPMLASARNWAHSKGLTQSDFSELIAIQASSKAAEQAYINTAAAAEVAKLGAAGPQRVSAIDTYLRGLLGDDLAAPMRSVMVTEKIVRGWEIIMQKFQSQGVANFSQSGREPGHDPRSGRVSDEQYNAMKPSERLDYARQFDQSQFKDGR